MHLFPVQLQFYSVLFKQCLLAKNKRRKEHQELASAKYLTASPLPMWSLKGQGLHYRNIDF